MTVAALSVTNPTLLDLARTMDPDGSIAKVVELLNQTNGLEDMTYIEGNLPTGHRSTIRTGLPTPTWRKLYGGVQPSRSTKLQVTDNCGMLEDYAEVDKALADLNGNTAAFRLSEDKAHIEGIAQELASTLFYGNESTEPAAFTGLAPRYNSLTAENALNLINGSGVAGQTDCTSVWLTVWGPETVTGIIPKGSKAGIQITDKGVVTVENVDGNGGRMEAYRTHYRLDAGLAVRDWRYVARAHSIDVSTLTKNAGTGADLIDLMGQMLEVIPNLNAGRAVFYCNRTVRSFLRRQIMNKVANSTLTMEKVAGKQVMFFGEVPVKRCDAITNTETSLN